MCFPFCLLPFAYCLNLKTRTVAGAGRDRGNIYRATVVSLFLPHFGHVTVTLVFDQA